MALQEMIRVSSDDMIREILEMREKARMDEASRLWYAEQNKSINIAKNLLKMNMPIEQIAQATELPIEEIQKLSEEMR